MWHACQKLQSPTCLPLNFSPTLKHAAEFVKNCYLLIPFILRTEAKKDVLLGLLQLEKVASRASLHHLPEKVA